MAASEKTRDYYHLVLSYLKDEKEKVVSIPFNFFSWETLANDRAETYYLIDKVLHPEFDLITIQLSENTSDLKIFEEDYKDLLLHIIRMCPKVKIISIGDFWDENCDETKESICSELNINYISLDPIRNDSRYMAGMGILYLETMRSNIK